MKRGEQSEYEIFGRKLTSLANWTVRIVGGCIFAVLAWYAMRYTQYVNPLGEETPVNIHDSMLKNFFAFGLAVAAFVGLTMLEQRMKERTKVIVARLAITVASAAIGIGGLWWITAVDRQPVGDQAFVYGGASYFMAGEYHFLDIGGYCSMYPHQLGLIALIEFLFQLVGPFNYFAYQLICVELAVGIVLLGYALLRQLTDSMAVVVSYCGMMLFCFPLVFYTSWVYGEIPSVFFSMLTALSLVKYEKTNGKRWLVVMVLSILMAVLVRKNSLIMLIAVCLVGGVYWLRKLDMKLLIALLAAVLLPILSYEGIYKMYEVRSGYPHMEGVLPISFVTMGMQESYGKYGWYNNYGKEVFYESEMDPNMGELICREDMRLRLAEFKENPSYMVHFFREKILSQWNMPLHQSLFFSSQYWEGKEPAPDNFVIKITGVYFPVILGMCDRLQFVLYIGLFCYFVFAVKGDSNIMQHMLAVTIIGGFLFSVIWEAKGRYIFPYYVTMYPLAVIGYQQVLSRIRTLMKPGAKMEREDNIVSFEHVA